MNHSITNSILHTTSIASYEDVTQEWFTFLGFDSLDAYYDDVIGLELDYHVRLGAYLDLKCCANSLNSAYLMNMISVENAVSIASELSISLLYIKMVPNYDGSKEICDDWGTSISMGHYPRSKHFAELFLMKTSSCTSSAGHGG